MRALVLIAGAVWIGCSGPAKPGGGVAPALPPLRAPACTGKVAIDEPSGGAKLFVGAVDLGITIEGEHPDRATAVTYPYGPRSILLTWTAPGHYGGFDGGSEIWEVDCDAPANKKSFLAIEGANFGASAMTRDGKTLYFSGPTYVRALDVATKAVRVVSRPGKIKHCWVAESAEEGHQLVDTILSLDEEADALIVSRGGACGFEGDYEGTVVYIDHPAAPRAERTARPTTSVAIDAGGAWWVASDRVLWVTTDGGSKWRKAPIPDDTTGPGAIHPDPKRPGHAVVQTVVVHGYGPASGGWIYATRDAGASWQLVPLPADIELSENGIPGKADSMLYAAVEVKSSTDHLVLWGTPKDAPEASKGEEPAGLGGTWETTDGGKTWKRIPAPHPAKIGDGVKLEARTAKGVTVKAAKDGLLVVEPRAAKPRRIYPH